MGKVPPKACITFIKCENDFAFYFALYTLLVFALSHFAFYTSPRCHPVWSSVVNSQTLHCYAMSGALSAGFRHVRGVRWNRAAKFRGGAAILGLKNSVKINLPV